MVDMSSVNWSLLREQKQELLAIRSVRAISNSEASAIDGIIHLIDFIQDESATQLGETVVFGEKEEK